MAAFACRNFLLFSGLKKIPASTCDSYMRMLQMNPPWGVTEDDKKIAF